MEGVLCKTAPSELPTDVINQSSHNEVLISKKNYSQKDKTPDKDENLEVKETKQEEKNGCNGSESPRSPPSGKGTDSAPQKTTSSSPTLIGSAIKVMKNLFSPDKQKSVHSGVLSPINQQKNAAGPPCGSVYVSGKTELFSSEPGVSFQSGENSKNNLQISETGVIQSPLLVDNLSNTDESFLTTVSLIDDSFHSAVTDIDDNGDLLKTGAKVENILTNSQSMDFADSCNDTLETNESLLENTTLKVGGFTPEGKSGNASVHSRGESFEMLKATQSFVLMADDFGKSQVIGNKKPGAEGNDTNGAKKSLSEKLDSEEVNANEKVEMAHIFLNKSFEKSSSEQSGISLPESYVLERLKKLNGSEARGRESEVLLKGSNHDCLLGDSISTTTVVLDTYHSQDLDNVMQAGDYETQSSFTSFENVSSSENVDKAGRDLSLNSKQASDSCDSWRAPTAARMISPQKKCVSEENSPSNRTIKIKLNKSDELINRRTSSEPPDGKNNCSVDVSLMKSVESSEPSEGFVRKDHQPDVGKLNSATNKPEAEVITSQLSYTILINHNNALNRPVIDSKTLNSPQNETFQAVAKPEKCSGASFDRDAEVKQSTPLWNGKTERNRQFCRSPSSKGGSPELKESGFETAKAPASKPDLLSKAMEIFSSNEMPLKLSPVSPGDGRANVFLNSTGSEYAVDFRPREESRQDLGKASQMKKPGSPSHQKSLHKKGKAPTPNKHNQHDPQKLNLTFDKSPVSPKSKMCNSTFVKSRELHEADKTFEVTASPDTAQLNKTYDKPVGQLNQTFDLKAECLEAQKLNETFDKKRPESPLHSKINQVVGSCQENLAQDMNKTFDSVPIAETTAPKAAEAEAGRAKEQTKAADSPLKEAPPESNVLPSETAKSEKSNELNGSPVSSTKSVSLASSDLSTAMLNEEFFPSNDSIDLSEKLEKVDSGETVSLPGLKDSPDDQAEEKLLTSLKNEKLQYDPELVQLIQEQFSSNDIEKICSVVQDFSSLKLSSDIMKASEQFDKSFHGNLTEPEMKSPETEVTAEKTANPLSPKSFDFLNSIGGKPTGRDWSRESLYVKFDPLVQPTANSLIDFTKEGEALPVLEDSPSNAHNSSICEQLLTISPQKKPVDIVPPLTPLSHKVKADENESKTERLKELQNEIYFLKNLYAEREKTNKAKIDEMENQFTKLTADVCFLEDKVKECNEREKSLAKKVTEQTQNIGQLNVIMEEYVKVISKLTSELETLKTENRKQIENLSLEKDSYMTHLQNTEAAFTDVHAKYEKSKKTIAGLKSNEALFRNTIAEQAHKMEDLMAKAREVEERAATDLQRAREELDEAKANHVQETARLRAQLRKTELKVEALQESLEQKVKENQQLTAICDELIEGKK